MRNYASIGVQAADILLPAEKIDLTKWAVIACDQFTSQPEYWREVEAFIGDAPSTFNLVLPEVYLGAADEAARIRQTQSKMREYLANQIFEPVEGLILVERTCGKSTRRGLVLALDLEKYDFNKGSQSLIRATEGTILDRLPPRMRIREDALLELPHILVLIDDPQQTVIEPLYEGRRSLRKVYDFDLMLGSGHLRGWLVDDLKLETQMIRCLEKLAEPGAFQAKYGVGQEKGVLLFAMGDGNHSLATAKAIWEKIKPIAGMDHPARYALVEIENVHDEGLVFEPIHRVLFAVKEDLHHALSRHFGERFRFAPCQDEQEMAALVARSQSAEHAIGLTSASGCGVIYIASPTSNLPVGTLQAFLDEWLMTGAAGHIDYVHGPEVVAQLGRQPGNLGFFLPAMQKCELFKTVILDGALPRKTFSMGEARDKRFYLECRQIACK